MRRVAVSGALHAHEHDGAVVIWLVEIVIVSLSIMNAFYRQLVILHEKTMKLEESSIKAQYTALQNQLNPHFLFNSLNTLISEIEYNPENAVVFTTKDYRMFIVIS